MADGLGETLQQIRAFMANQFAGVEGLEDTESLLESGIVDSIGILEVVTFLEEQFGVTITDDDLLADHFESVASMAALVWDKRGGEQEPSAA